MFSFLCSAFQTGSQDASMNSAVTWMSLYVPQSFSPMILSWVHNWDLRSLYMLQSEVRVQESGAVLAQPLPCGDER